jgi:hypothetical protein
MRVATILALVLLIVSTVGCKKSDDTTTGGKTGVVALAVIPAWSVRGGYFYVDDSGMVYIKYNTTTFPGSNGNLYDDSAMVFSRINLVYPTQTTLTGLSNGDYYIYFKGKINHMPVSGGEHYKIIRQNGSHELILPVTP